MPTISMSSWIGSPASQSVFVKWPAADWAARSPRKATSSSKNSRKQTLLSNRHLATAVRDAKSIVSHNRPRSVIIGRRPLPPCCNRRVSMTVRIPISRRRFLATAAASTAITAVVPKPYLSRAADRPVITHGIQSGDVSLDSAVIWARADRPARMLAEVATSDSFKTIHRAVFVDALPETDFTANALIDGLPAGQDIFYRIRFQDLASPTIVGEPMTGRFRTAPSDQRSISFVWSGDTAGQGWGIDEARGGMRTYATMLRNRPDFFIHNGDNIYADGPILAEQKMPNGEIWKNVVMEEKTKPAETLAEFRANYKYNLLDRNVLAFNAEVPIFSQWDDHEVTNNWWPGEPLTRAEHQRKKYVEKNALILAARASRAFHEYMPLRFTQ